MTTTSIGRSLHIGLNRVNPDKYEGWDGELKGCENDACSMEAIAAKQGFQTQVLLSDQATAAKASAAIKEAAAALHGGDIFLVTYSGHGGQVPDRNGDEEDNYDETWVLYDRQLVDDELYKLWGSFAPGVRIFVLSDSCHSGSAVRDMKEQSGGYVPENLPRPRGLDAAQVQKFYAAHAEDYDQIQRDNPLGHKVQVGASIILISGCQDDEVSLDGNEHGLFTNALLKTWNGGKYKGSISNFHKRIRARLDGFQEPNLFTVGTTDAAYMRQRPFTV